MINQEPTKNLNPSIAFHREGIWSSGKAHKTKQSKLLKGANDWKVLVDLEEALKFPIHIVDTNLRPDIIVWSDATKRVHLAELTVPWEDNMQEAYERKKAKYDPLRADCEDKGWSCQVFPIEIGCRGFIGRSTISFLTRLGVNNHKMRAVTKRLQTAAERASSWIWSKSHDNTQHIPKPVST